MMKVKRFYVTNLLIVTGVLCANFVAGARATTLIPADLGELTHDAIAIARGRVVAADGRWTDDRRAIETIVTLQVDTYLKGDLGATVQFRVPGGLLGRFRSIVVGAPRFTADDRVIVFLAARGPMVPYIVGFSQGVYRVVRDGAAGARDAWLVTPPPIAATTSATPMKVVRGDPSRVPLPLDTFEAQVRALVGAAK
jgi:hypothetical protein